MSLNIHAFRTESELNQHFSKDQVVQFLFTHLDQYGDAKQDIAACMDYVFNPSRGGVVIVAEDEKRILGVSIINHTGMSGYIPENILVYIAVDGATRGQGIGKKIMQKAISEVEGNIALHVEPDNPAKLLYEKLGFTNKYLEMRLQKA